MAKSSFHPDPIEAGPPLVVDNSPVVPGVDPLDAGLRDSDRRENDLADARGVLASLKGHAVSIPTLRGLIGPLEERIGRADRYHLDAEDAEQDVRVATRTRDVHEAAALRVPGGDPVATAAGAQEALDEALKRAERVNRLANTTVMLALQEAHAAKRRIRLDIRANAPRLTREKLREYEQARAAAEKAVGDAQSAIRRAMGTHSAVCGIATHLPEDDRLRGLVARSEFDPFERRTGTNQPTMEGVLQHLDSVPERLGYGADHPHRAYPVVGSAFGDAVKLAEAEADSGE